MRVFIWVRGGGGGRLQDKNINVNSYVHRIISVHLFETCKHIILEYKHTVFNM